MLRMNDDRRRYRPSIHGIQGRPGQDRTGQDRTGQDRTVQTVAQYAPQMATILYCTVLWQPAVRQGRDNIRSDPSQAEPCRMPRAACRMPRHASPCLTVPHHASPAPLSLSAPAKQDGAEGKGRRKRKTGRREARDINSGLAERRRSPGRTSVTGGGRRPLAAHRGDGRRATGDRSGGDCGATARRGRCGVVALLALLLGAGGLAVGWRWAVGWPPD